MLPRPNQFYGHKPDIRTSSRSPPISECNSKTVNNGKQSAATMEDDLTDESACDPEDPTMSILDIDFNLNKDSDEIIKLNEYCAQMTNRPNILNEDITLREMGDRDYRFLLPMPAVTDSLEESIDKNLKIHRFLSENKPNTVQEKNGENAEQENMDNLEFEELMAIYNNLKKELTLLNSEEDQKESTRSREGSADTPIEFEDISEDEIEIEEANKLSIVLENNVLPEQISESPNTTQSINLNCVELEEEENILREQLIRKLLEKRTPVSDDPNNSDSAITDLDLPSSSQSVVAVDSSLHDKVNSNSPIKPPAPEPPKIDFSRYRLLIQLSGDEDSETESSDSDEFNIQPQTSTALQTGRPSRTNVIQKLSTSQQEEYQKLKQEIERRELKTVSSENLQKYESKLRESMKKKRQKVQKMGILKQSIISSRKELKKSQARVQQLQKQLALENKKVYMFSVKLKIDTKEMSEAQKQLKDEMQMTRHYKKVCLNMGKTLSGSSYTLPSLVHSKVVTPLKTTRSFNEVVKNNMAKNHNKKSEEEAAKLLRGKVNFFLKPNQNHKAVLLFEHYVSFNFTLIQSSNFYKSSHLIQFNEFSEKRSDVLNVNLDQFPQLNTANHLTTESYSSVLQHFNSYRFALNQLDNISTNHWSNGLDPNLIICSFDMFGVCNDSNCKNQHKKDYLYGPQEKIMDVLTYVPELAKNLNLSQFKNDPQELRKVLSNNVQSKLGQYGKNSTELVCREISKDIRKQSKTSVSSFFIRSIPKELVNFGDHKAPVDAQVAFDDYIYRFNLKDETFQMKLSKLLDLQTDNDPDLYLRNRFFAPEGIPISAQLETSLASDPHNIQMWINLAYCYWKRFKDDKNDINFCIDSSLNVLSRALDANRDNAELYEHYLHFYSNKVDLIAANKIISSPDIVPIDEICRRILQFCSTYHLWVRYLSLCDKLSHKELVALTILKQFCSSKITYADEVTRSLNILEIIMYRINLYLQLNKLEDAVKFFYEIFTQKATSSTSKDSPNLSNLSLLVTKEHRVFAWLCYIHLVLYHDLPYHSFRLSKGSFLHLVDVRPFVIHWKSISPDNDLQHIEMLLNRAINNCCATAEIDDNMAAHTCNQSNCNNSCFPLRFNLAQLSKVIQSTTENVEMTNSYSYLSTVYSDNFVALSHLHILQLFEIDLTNDERSSNESIVLTLIQNFYNAYNQNTLRSFTEWNDQLLEALKHQVQFDYWLAFYHYKCNNFSKCKEILTQILLYFYRDTLSICDLSDNLLQQLFELILFEDFTFDSTVHFEEQEAIRNGLKFGRDKRTNSKLVYLYLSYLMFFHVAWRQSGHLTAEKHYLKLDCVFSSVVSSFTSRNLATSDDYKFLWLNYFLILLEFPYSDSHFKSVYDTLRLICVTFNSSDPLFIYHLTNVFSKLIVPNDRLYFLIEISKLNPDNANLIIKVLKLSLHLSKKETCWNFILHIVNQKKIRLHCYEFWKIAISLSIERNDHLNTHKFFQMALTLMPYSLEIWEMLKNYETSINHVEHLRQLEHFYKVDLDMKPKLFDDN